MNLNKVMSMMMQLKLSFSFLIGIDQKYAPLIGVEKENKPSIEPSSASTMRVSKASKAEKE
jgi:hypothetical protein